VIVAVLFASLDLLLFSDLVADSGSSPGTKSVQAAGAGAGFLILVFRRRFPWSGLVAVCALSAGLSQFANFRMVFLVALALGTATSRTGGFVPAAAIAAALLTSSTWVATEIRTSPELDSAGGAFSVAIGYALILLVAAGVGRWARTGRERLRLLDERRREEARQAMEAERLRLARELHDIVSHAVTLMMLQAAGARRLMATDQSRADEALATVERAGGRAMGELRRLLGVLRVGSQDAGTEVGSKLPGLRDLPQLLEEVRGAGVEVELKQEGEPRTLDASVDLAAYRVVQEALTNVTKHAGRGACAVTSLIWGTDQLEIRVTNEASGTSGAPEMSTGHGILGLKERVSVAGGRMEAAPVADGGFMVRAVLPVSGGDRLLEAEPASYARPHP
jgi:signal transduction histidine kinase